MKALLYFTTDYWKYDANLYFVPIRENDFSLEGFGIFLILSALRFNNNVCRCRSCSFITISIWSLTSFSPVNVTTIIALMRMPPLYFLLLGHQLTVEHLGLILYVSPSKNIFHTHVFVSVFCSWLWEMFFTLVFPNFWNKFAAPFLSPLIVTFSHSLLFS